MASHQQIQRYNERLSINNETLDTATIVQQLSKAENARLKKLSLINIKTDTASVISNLLSDLKGSLETLSVQSNLAHSEDIQTIIDCIINNNTTLIKLTLSVINAAYTTIINAVQSSLLQKLTFKKVYVDTSTVFAISNVIKVSHLHLTELSFIQCKFQKGALALITATVTTSAIVTLVLESIHFDIDDTIAVADCIARSRLTKLSLYGSKIAPLLTDNTSTGVIERATKAATLETLDVRDSSFFNIATDIIDIIKFAPITKFKFGHRRFSPEEDVAIIDAIKGRRDYKIIPMFGTKFTDEILTKVCDLLVSSRALVCLDLGCCHLSEERSVIIINSMKGSSIVSLNFESNYVYDEGKVISAICDLLVHCNIKRIEFAGLTNVGIAALLPSIKKSSLTKFKMHDWSKVSISTRATIKEILRTQRNIFNRTRKTKSARA